MNLSNWNDPDIKQFVDNFICKKCGENMKWLDKEYGDFTNETTIKCPKCGESIVFKEYDFYKRQYQAMTLKGWFIGNVFEEEILTGKITLKEAEKQGKVKLWQFGGISPNGIEIYYGDKLLQGKENEFK